MTVISITEKLPQKASIQENNISNLSRQLEENKENAGILKHILEKLGRLPNDYNPDVLIKLTYNKNAEVRQLAVKNLGKLRSDNLMDIYKFIATHDKSTLVRREAVSSLGRMRSYSAVDFLLSMLNEKDPKILMQVIRALLVFKGNSQVDDALRRLQKHENEMVSSVIERAYSIPKKTVLSIPHVKTYKWLKDVIVNCDVRDAIRLVPSDSIHLTFTSPPYYNARDYSIYESYDAYLNFLEEVFKETHRITKEGRFLIVNTSPVIVPRISRAHSSKRYAIPFDLHARLVNNGWEFIDDIVWKKPEYSVKNRIGGFQQHRKPLGYKPNAVTEYLMVYRKKTDKLLDWNMHQYNIETIESSRVDYGYETTNVWEIAPKSDKVHSAVFPVELCRRVISYYSYKGDIVFDPFAGSGTLGRTAKSMDRFFFMTEKETIYFDYMKSFVGKHTTDDRETHFMSLEQFKSIIP